MTVADESVIGKASKRERGERVRAVKGECLGEI